MQTIGQVDKNKKKKTDKEEMLLGIDYGEKYIGLAFARSGSVVPLEVLHGIDLDGALTKINKFVLENRVNKIVIGLPLTRDGKETMQSRKTRDFARRLKIRLKLPVEFVNEYMSTKDSIMKSTQLGMKSGKTKRLDHISAAVILRQYYREKSIE